VAVEWPLPPPLPLFIASQTAQDWVKSLTKENQTRPNRCFMAATLIKWMGWLPRGSRPKTTLSIYFETDKLLNGILRIYQVNIRQASNQTEPNQFKLAKHVPFRIKPALLLVSLTFLSVFWVVWRRNERRWCGLENKRCREKHGGKWKEKENRISGIFKEGWSLEHKW